MEIFIIIWAIFSIAICHDNRCYDEITFDSCTDRKIKRNVAIIIFLPLLLWTGLRTGEGHVDTNAYINLYRVIPSGFDAIKEYVSSVGKDQGFYWFTGIMKMIFGYDNYHPYLFVIALIQTLSLIKLYRDYSLEFGLSFFFFIASADYYAWMFNGIRQFFAIAIIYLAIPSLINKKYLRFFTVVLFASLFHRTSLIMLPISLIVNGRAWNKKTMLFIALGVFAILFTGRFTGLMEEALEDTVYYLNIQEMKMQTGTNILRVAFYSMPALIAFIGRNKLEMIDSPIIDVSINMSIVTAVLYFISMVTSGIMMGRLPIYASLFNYILIPLEIRYIFKDNNAIRLGFIITYCLYYIVLMHFTYGVF